MNDVSLPAGLRSGDLAGVAARPLVDGWRGRRVAIVGSVAIFRERAGRAAYLASFCRVLRSMGFRVDLLFLNAIAGRHVQLRLLPDYRESVDAVAVRGALQVGTRFLAKNPEQWLRAALKAATSPRPARPADDVWHMPWPGDEALQWARRRLSVIAPDIVVANYFNASRVFGCVDPACVKAILVHDVFALRKQSYQASGYPLDFDERMIAAEAEAFASADLCVAITPEDAAFIRQQHPGVEAVALPHVLDIPAERPRRPPRRCVFVGSDNEPNRRGLAWLLDEVWPLVVSRDPDIGLRVVGNIASTGLLRPGEVVFAGMVDDLAGEYLTASVALVPLRAGSGLKVKLIEALAHGVPVVSTSVGAEGVEAAPPEILRIHDDPERFAEAILALTEPSAWATRSAGAAAFARAHYSEGAASAALARAFEALGGIAGSRRGHGARAVD